MTRMNVKMNGKRLAALGLAALLALACWGWRPRASAMGAQEGSDESEEAEGQGPVLVQVQRAVSGDVTSSREYIGTVEAVQTVRLCPEVSARVAGVHFKEGAFVKEGAPLFTLEDAQFQATAALRKAELSRAEANLGRARKYLERLKAADRRSVPASDLDVAESDVKTAQAAVAEAKANLRLARIDLDHTKIAAPISGRIGRANFTKGNYVTPDSELAVIVQMDPIRVAFAMPDRDYLEERQAFAGDGDVYQAELRLADGTAYPFPGERDFEDNAMDPGTGTIALRLRFRNEGGALVPGAMVRVSLTPRDGRTGVLVPQTAIQSDLQGDFVYVVQGDEAQVRRVAIGNERGRLRAVEGVEAGETVVSQGLQGLAEVRAMAGDAAIKVQIAAEERRGNR